MRKWVFGILALAIVVSAVPAVADEDFEFETDGQVRARLDWFDSFNDVDNGGNDNEEAASFWPFRANIGLTGSFNEMFSAYIEFQAYGFFGDDNTGLQGYSGTSGGNVDLYQGYATLNTDRWNFKFGRMEHQIGNELIIGNNSFYNGQVFDGITASSEYDSWGLDLFLFKVTEGPLTTPGDSDDTNLYGIDVDFMLGKAALTPYLLYLKDDSAMKREIGTVGILYNRPNDDNNGWDLNLELAGQFGENGTGMATVDNKGIIFEGWFGWTFGDAGRIHVGALYASGSDDPTENGWISLFEDGHAYNRLGNLDLFNAGLTGTPGRMTNIQDLNVGYTWGPSADSKHQFFAALHQFTRPETVGGADDDLGIEFDVTYSYQIVHNSALQIGAGFLSAGDALGPLADDTMRLWLQVESSWGSAKPWTSIGQEKGWMN